MATVLAGEGRVSEMKEGTPLVVGPLRIWNQIGRSTGAEAISLRILEFGPGASPQLSNRQADEVFYFLENLDGSESSSQCTVSIDDRQYEVGAQTGFYLRPGQTLTVDNPGSSPVIFVSSQCPDETYSDKPDASSTPAAFNPSLAAAPFVRLSDRAAMPTADRWYRVLVDDEIGSEQITQFVGSIPPGRAPDHFHNYEEVLFILSGTGRMWAGETHAPIAPGSCIYLPKGQVHCVENTGEAELRLLGAFYPAGSPAVRYEA